MFDQNDILVKKINGYLAVCFVDGIHPTFEQIASFVEEQKTGLTANITQTRIQLRELIGEYTSRRLLLDAKEQDDKKHYKVSNLFYFQNRTVFDDLLREREHQAAEESGADKQNSDAVFNQEFQEKIERNKKAVEHVFKQYEKEAQENEENPKK